MQKNLMISLMVMVVLLAAVGVSSAAEVGKWEAYRSTIKKGGKNKQCPTEILT